MTKLEYWNPANIEPFFEEEKTCIVCEEPLPLIEDICEECWQSVSELTY